MILIKPTSVRTPSFLVNLAAIFVCFVTFSFQALANGVNGGRKFARYRGNLESGRVGNELAMNIIGHLH